MRVATLKLPPPPSLSTIVIKMIFNEAFLISLISSFSYLYTYFMRWKRCDGDIDSIEYRTTICGVHGLVFQSSGGSSYGQRKRQTHVMGDVLPTLARCLINDILSCMACASMMIFNLKQTKKKLPSILKLCEPSEFQECDAMAAMADGVACILCRVCLFHCATCRNGNDIFRHVFVFNIFGAAVEQHAECC